MSLYADEDLTLTSYSNNVPSTVDADPVSAFATALAAPPESPAQDQALLDAGSRFEQQPDKLPELCAQLLPMVVEGNDTMLRRWALEMVLLAVGRAKLAGEVKLQGECVRLNRDGQHTCMASWCEDERRYSSLYGSEGSRWTDCPFRAMDMIQESEGLDREPVQLRQRLAGQPTSSILLRSLHPMVIP